MRRREFANPDILRSPALIRLTVQKRTFGSRLACPRWVISGQAVLSQNSALSSLVQ